MHEAKPISLVSKIEAKTNKLSNGACTITTDALKELFDSGQHAIPIYRNIYTNEIFTPDWKTDIQTGNGVHDFGDAVRWLNTTRLKKANGIALRMESPNFMFDFDLKNTEDKNIFHQWWNVVINTNENIEKKVCYETTKSGGYHVYGRYPGINHKTRLAANPEGNEVIAIYTGGLLSYCYPTPGYEMKHNWWNDIEELTQEEFDLLVSCAAYFDKYTPDENSSEPMTGGSYPDEHKLLFEFFDKNCTDELFEKLLNDIKLYSTGKTGTVRKLNATFHFFLRQGSTAKFSAKVFFTGKSAFIFSASYCNWPTFHTRHQYGFWKLTPAWIIYFNHGRDWNKTLEIIKAYCEKLEIKISEPKKNSTVLRLLDE